MQPTGMERSRWRTVSSAGLLIFRVFSTRWSRRRASVELSSSSESDGIAGVVERMRARVGDRPVYVSVDIDVLDPAHAPGTGTPEAGGMTSRELLTVLRAFGDLNLVSADIVEVSPAYDHAQLTGIAAAHVGLHLRG
jgi:agmatinase